jgi:HEAT repeat protein
LPEEAYISYGYNKGLLKMSDAANQRLMNFPVEVRINALIDGLDDNEAHVRAACAFHLLHIKHAKVLAAMRRHLNDLDDRVVWRAKFYVKYYGGAL